MRERTSRRLDRFRRRLQELRAWRDAGEHPVSRWSFTGPDGATREIELGETWPVAELPVSLAARTVVPQEWAGLEVELNLWLGGEGFVRLSNGVEGGLDPFHRSFAVTGKARGGEPLEIKAEVVPKGPFGSHVSEPKLLRASLVVPESGVRALERDLSVVADACAELAGHEVVTQLLDVLDAAFARLDECWPTDTEVALTRSHRAYTDPLGRDLWSLPPAYLDEAVDFERMGQELWALPLAPRPLESLPEEARRVVDLARSEVAQRLEELRREYPPVGRLALTGHAHLDLAWLWPLSETRRKARRTFASVLGLMDRHEDFVFNQSSAQLYAWIEADHPALFERVRARVREDRWEPVGGSWTEPDCQMPGGEAFVRQLLYGQRYFREKFGRTCTVAWLPDAFGFSPGIPQLLRGAGMGGFFTCKLSWNEANAFPHDLFAWEGLDGSTVTAHMTANPGTDYNGVVRPLDLLGTWRNFKQKGVHAESLFPFGWGDGGGGPSRRMLEGYARLKSFPALPRLRMERVEDFFASLPPQGDLPRWVGELYLELHRGTLTSQGRIKALNRAAEHRLAEAEAFCALAWLRGAEYPTEELESAWKTLLLNQFHDILPGSSIAEVYGDAHPQLEAVVADATSLRDGALRGRRANAAEPDADAPILVANAGLAPRSLSALLPGLDDSVAVTDAGGEPLPTQPTEDGLLVRDPARRVPGLGYATLLVSRRESASRESEAGAWVERVDDGWILENEVLIAVVGEDGCLSRVFDKAASREVLDGRGNRLVAYADKPREWDAWDIDEDYESGGREVGGVEGIEALESGPLRCAVRVRRAWRGSRIVQTYRLEAGSRRLEVETSVEWHERQVLLRALFPVTVRSHEAVFETMYGVVRRPTHRNTTWDAARFEVAAHRFVDLSEPGYGVALLNNGRYGHSVRDSVVGISLLRSPINPDPLADEGEHRFTYSLFPHPGDWTEAGVAREALALNSPLFVAEAGPDAEPRPPEFGLVRAGGVELAMGCLKRAEDGGALILRLYEPHGARGEAVLRFGGEISRVTETDLLEYARDGDRLSVFEGREVRVRVRPFEVLTLRLKFQGTSGR